MKFTVNSNELSTLLQNVGRLVPASNVSMPALANYLFEVTPERTLRAPPLPFGRRPPQSNCPPGTVRAPDGGRALGRRSDGGSIPRAPPRGLAPPLRGLLPILYAPNRRPMPSCSEGSRGLSVLPQVARIFTSNAISPGPWSRQRPSRYAVRAGRNLPDKECRYLRMVIVTTAVYWGLNSQLRSQRLLTGPLNLPAPGRRQSIYINLTSSHGPVFLINSRFPLFSATPQRFPPQRVLTP